MAKTVGKMTVNALLDLVLPAGAIVQKLSDRSGYVVGMPLEMNFYPGEIGSGKTLDIAVEEFMKQQDAKPEDKRRRRG